jgi:hypothetical protein
METKAFIDYYENNHVPLRREVTARFSCRMNAPASRSQGDQCDNLALYELFGPIPVGTDG